MSIIDVPQWFFKVSLIISFLGVCSHWLHFRRGEFDLTVWKYIIAALVVQAVAVGVLESLGWGLFNSGVLILLLSLSYFLPLFFSIAVYRLFLHPLRKFPGPTWARLSMFWKMNKMIRQNPYQMVDEMHRKYGPVVRLGPRLLSINKVSAIQPIHGAGSKCRKPAFYELAANHGIHSLNTERDPKVHSARRPAWDKALSARTIKEYEPCLMKLTNLLVTKFEDYDGTPVVVNSWIQCFSFDLMGELGFSKTYRSLETGKLHPAVQKIKHFLQFGGILGQVPWLTDTLSRIPFMPNPLQEYRDLAAKNLEERKKETLYSPNAMTYVFEGKYKLTQEQVVEDSILLQIAGSDTTQSSLVFALYHLTANNEIQQELREEIRNAVPSGEQLRFSHIAKLPLLEAVIHETMRLHPAVPSGMPRYTPKDGIWVDEIFIPGEMCVSTPTWTIHHDPSNFDDADLFIPKRWMPSHRDQVLEKRAFIPFSTGPYNCVGQIFAIMEMKTVIARLVQTFYIEFAPGEKGKKLFTESKDHLTMDAGPLVLCFNRRG